MAAAREVSHLRICFEACLGSQITAVSVLPEVVGCAVASRASMPEVVIVPNTSPSVAPPAVQAADRCRITTMCLMRGETAIIAAFASRSGAYVVECRRHSLTPTSTARLISPAGAEAVEPDCSVFDASGKLVAFGIGRRIDVVRLSGGHFARLVGHRRKITSLAFFDDETSHLLASASEDRTFRVWDLVSQACAYQSAIFPSVLACLATHRGRVAVTGTDGRLWMHELLTQPHTTCRQTSVVDMQETACKARRVLNEPQCDMRISSTPSHRTRASAPIKGAMESRRAPDHTSLLPLAAFFDVSAFDEDSDHVAGTDATSVAPLLVAASSNILVINSMACDVAHVLKHCGEDGASIGMASHAAFCGASIATPSNDTLQHTHVALSSAFEPRVYAGVVPHSLRSAAPSRNLPSLPLSISPNQLQPLVAPDETQGALVSCLSFFMPRAELSRNSPLLVKEPMRRTQTRSEILAWDSYNKSSSKQSTLTTTAMPSASSKQANRVPDMPVLFHSRIKSSGYGELSTRARPSAREKPPRLGSSVKKSTKKSQLLAMKRYPMDCGILSSHQPQHDFHIDGSLSTNDANAIASVACADDARTLAIATANGPTLIHQLPISSHRATGPTVLGRDPSSQARRLGVAFSHDCKLLLTTTVSGSVEIWPVNGQQCVNVPRLVLSPRSTRGSSKATARFFFLDRFILSAYGGQLEMRTFHISAPDTPAHVPAAGSFQINGQSKLAHSFHHGDVQSLSAIGCINTELSPLIITAASNRSVHILDASVGRTASIIQDAHTKAVHTLALPLPTSATHSIPQACQFRVLHCFCSVDNSAATRYLRPPRPTGQSPRGTCVHSAQSRASLHM